MASRAQQSALVEFGVLTQANPFGAAKPVDATARLQEIEERAAKRKVCYLNLSTPHFLKSEHQVPHACLHRDGNLCMPWTHVLKLIVACFTQHPQPHDLKLGHCTSWSQEISTGHRPADIAKLAACTQAEERSAAAAAAEAAAKKAAEDEKERSSRSHGPSGDAPPGDRDHGSLPSRHSGGRGRRESGRGRGGGRDHGRGSDSHERPHHRQVCLASLRCRNGRISSVSTWLYCCVWSCL